VEGKLDIRGISHILSRIKQDSFPSLCIGENHGTVLELMLK